MRELSLFTGVGGGLLGTHGLLGWECVGAVEWEEYPCRVLRQRQIDGVLNEFPIWHMDIGDFNRRFAAGYTGLVDVVTAGFPCQPFSLAGQQRGADDERNQWPATIECIRIVRPRFCLLENVPGLISNGYLGTVLGDLAACGYDARWRVLSAAELGAPHKRDRLWIVADANGKRQQEQHLSAFAGGKVEFNRPSNEPTPRLDRSPDAIGSDGHGRRGDVQMGRRGRPRNVEETIYAHGDQWSVEPDVGRVANGVPSRVDRLKGLGNGQVPAVAAAAWLLLTEDLT